MKILITGATGFIGQHLVKLLPDSDVFDLSYGDDVCEELPDEDYTHVIHLAAKKSVWLGELEPRDFVYVNCWGTLNIALSYPNARVLNISSSSVNDVRSVYGLTKQFSESIGQIHKNWLNVRLYNVFGEGQSFESRAIVPSLVSSSLNGHRPTIFGDGEQERDFTYVGDVVLNLVDLLESEKTGVFHLGYGDSSSVNDLISQICPDKKPKYEKAKGYDIRNSKSPEAMPIIRYGRLEGLKRTIEWYERMN